MFALKSRIKTLFLSAIFIQYLTLLAIIVSATVYYRQLITFDRQVDTMKEQENNQLRAYIGPVRVWVKDYNPDGHVQIGVTTRNFGTTPAYNVDMTTYFEVQFQDDTNKARNQNPPFPASNQTQVIFPTGTMDFNTNIILSNDDRNDVVSAKKVLAFQGKIYYRTIFGDDEWSTFCYIFDSNDLKNAKQQPDENLVDLSCGNGSDGT